MRGLWTIWSLALAAILSIPVMGDAAESVSPDHIVYGVFRGLDFGNPGEAPDKDFYVNVGTTQGIGVGATLEVLRRTATYDVVNQKLYKDMTFPIARLKVIHAETNAAVARLEKLLPADKTPVIQPRAVMVGDLVRLAH